MLSLVYVEISNLHKETIDINSFLLHFHLIKAQETINVQMENTRESGGGESDFTRQHVARV